MVMLLTHKLGMMSVIDDEGRLQPITVLLVKPNFVTQIKTLKKDGYSALQIGVQTGQGVKKPQSAHGKKQGLKKACNRFWEIRLKEEEVTGFKVGQQLDVSVFVTGDVVSASGRSRGKGFAGTIKRHNFSRAPKSHGGKSHLRRPGAIGSIFPQRVVRGKKMAGRLGGQATTVKGLSVQMVDSKRQLLGIRGALPGPRRGMIIIKKAGKI